MESRSLPWAAARLGTYWIHSLFQNTPCTSQENNEVSFCSSAVSCTQMETQLGFGVGMVPIAAMLVVWKAGAVSSWTPSKLLPAAEHTPAVLCSKNTSSWALFSKVIPLGLSSVLSEGRDVNFHSQVGIKDLWLDCRAATGLPSGCSTPTLCIHVWKILPLASWRNKGRNPTHDSMLQSWHQPHTAPTVCYSCQREDTKNYAWLALAKSQLASSGCWHCTESGKPKIGNTERPFGKWCVILGA